ncbi:G-protein coupled receptor [Chloropicon primus]|uniref:G-protein coupled receptor n=1 Tax=Chloropicon primus TaxID=1764295 RepID=A0A5B8MC35_9CHLO|nr:G-protein coupled receptor [Chloropicon primus]UPQ97212.1 G-protein coupled receptor [Chloropicon primus]|mmetsp:Transcript_3743/g.10721  ORF Transcript_3743/g.10721 Transcript_3743/m.10721 type:complete len:333 (-) Transcript_3743:113-1111(-)|eukprot:QDZ17997.1 G-protein coupled receptor [Chloropicon primus]
MGASELGTSDQHTLTVVNQVFSGFSVCGSALIICSYVLFPSLRKFSYKLVLMLSISDFGNQGCSFLGNPNHEQALCAIQAVGIQFWSVASFLWTGAIAYVLRSTVIDKRTDIEGTYRKMHVFIWALSFGAAVIPSWAYAPTGAWCWIEGEDIGGKIMRFIFYYAPLWFVIGYNVFAYVSVIRYLRRVQLLANSINTNADSQPRFEMKAISRLGWYPCILIFCHTFATINRIQNWVSPHNPSFVLFLLHTCTQSLTGFLNCVAYGLNHAVRSAWFERFPFLKKLAVCGKGRENKFHKFENEMSVRGEDNGKDVPLDSPVDNGNGEGDGPDNKL